MKRFDHGAHADMVSESPDFLSVCCSRETNQSTLGDSMYFNPTVLHPAQNEQIANSYRELADILINGVDRQRELQWKRLNDSAMRRKAIFGRSRKRRIVRN